MIADPGIVETPVAGLGKSFEVRGHKGSHFHY